jgi:DNA topoisomerase-1
VKLLIVESPNKVKAIQGYLDKCTRPGEWRVAASAGHVRDLPMERGTALAKVIDTSAWNEHYVLTKQSVVSRLRQEARSASTVVLATDPDREGEAIAWHLADVLKLSAPQRVTFQEITAAGIARGIAAPRALDRALVEAQRARRVVDYLIGFELSPRLWPFGCKSAGRVQSAALRILVDRERAIRAFVPADFWTVTASYGEGFQATLSAYVRTTTSAAHAGEPTPPATDGAANSDQSPSKRLAPIRFKTGADADSAVSSCRNGAHVVERVDSIPTTVKPKPPFTTATLLGEASRALKWKPARTTTIAQTLFEQGYVTYIRTDSTALSDDAVAQIRDLLKRTHPQLVPDSPQVFAPKASAQGAHEAIRPTHIDDAGSALTGDERALYELIRIRTLCCQCASAEVQKTTITIALVGSPWRLVATGSVETRAGFRALERELAPASSRGAQPNQPQKSSGRVANARGIAPDDNDSNDNDAVDDDDANSASGTERGTQQLLPHVRVGQRLNLKDVVAKASQTKPPPRFGVRTFINHLEQQGIGRPSTLSTLFSTLTDRGYIEEPRPFLVPTEAGFLADDVTRMGWQKLTDEGYTALVEKSFDRIAEDALSRTRFLELWFADFTRMTTSADVALATFKRPRQDVQPAPGTPSPRGPRRTPTPSPPSQPSPSCPMCGARSMKRRQGARGPFWSCPNYPQCRGALSVQATAAPKDTQANAIARTRESQGHTYG